MATKADSLQEQAPAQVGWRRLWWPDPWWPGAAISLVALGGVAAFFIPLGGVDLSRINGLGLISVLPVTSLLGITVTVVAYSAGLCLPRQYPAVLGAMLVGIVICLDAVTAFVEQEPRFPSGYQMAGFVEYIGRTEHLAPGLAAYFNWPGFFGMVAFLERVAGGHSLIPVMRVWPVIVDLAYLAPLYFIMRNLRATWRAKWLSVFLFEAGNWVGQDYFSPQSFNYLLYLAFIAILLSWFNWRPQAQAVAPQATPKRAGPTSGPGGARRSASWCPARPSPGRLRVPSERFCSPFSSAFSFPRLSAISSRRSTWCLPARDWSPCAAVRSPACLCC